MTGEGSWLRSCAGPHASTATAVHTISVASVAAMFLPVSVTLGYSMADVFQFKPKEKLPSDLQDELWKVMLREEFWNMRNSELVGVLEYLKWNIINRSE